MEEKTQFEQPEKPNELLKFLRKILRNWVWILCGLIVSLVIAYLIVRYEDPIYQVKVSFVTKKFEESGSGTLGGIIDGNPFRQRIEVFQEIPLLKSEDKIRETLRRLDFDVSYFTVGRFKTTEVYRDYNFKVGVDTSSTKIPYGIPIQISSQKKLYYVLSSEDEDLNKRVKGKQFRFGAHYDVGGWSFSITKNNHVQEEDGYSYFFVLNHPGTLVSEYTRKLQISWQRQGSSILDGEIQSKIPEKDFKFMNTYMEVIIEKGLEEKNQHLINTIEFINEYMAQLSDTLLYYQDRIDRFRIENREIVEGSEILFTKLDALDKEKSELLFENRYLDYITRYISEKREEEIFAPNLLGIDAPLLTQLLGEYVEIKWTDRIDLNDQNKKNPLVNKGSAEYNRVSKNIFESIGNRKEINLMRIREINQEVGAFYTSLSDLQIASRKYAELSRMLNLYQSTVDALLSKRTDASIAKAATTSDYQVVASPSYSSVPIYPDSENVFLLFAVLGLGVPVGVIYFLAVFNNKVVSRDDLKKYTNIPLIGSIGHSKAHTTKVILESPKSNVAESFRGIRANLQYFLPAGEKSNVLLVTSSISSEGKTFCSINLAYTFALTGKKTIILGADMRRPSLSGIFDLKAEKGLSQYLAQMTTLEEVIYPTEMDSLFVIPAGAIPPNPSELLSSVQVVELLRKLKEKFELIIVDTPPIGLVADTMELIKHANQNLLIVRQGRTFKKSLMTITELYNEGKVPRLAILFNDIDFSKYEHGQGYGGGYGYHYGYGYGYYTEDDQKPGWFNKLFRK